MSRMGTRVAALLSAAVAGLVLVTPAALGQAGTGDTEVTVGSNDLIFSQNKQNEPAVAVDAARPNILAAGANDNIDMEACNAGDDTTCPFTAGVGVSGIYFSFNGGQTWTQPEYTGWTARRCLGVNDPPPPAADIPDECAPTVGPIGTLPWYYESGLVSDGDPALAFGPRPGPNGFSWQNGSRLYYANLTANFATRRSEQVFRGYEALAVSRTDNVQAAAANDKNAWMPPVVISRQSGTTFMDKEQIWADNAASSPYFGNVYVCGVAFRSNSRGNWAPSPLIVFTSRDGGETWTQKQVTPAGVGALGGASSGCTIRTDSRGRVYVFAVQFAFGFPGSGSHMMITSDNGGQNWSRPQAIFTAVDTCNAFDPVIRRCVQDGVAGARNDLGPAPSVDIANGAPTGADATDAIVDTWVDGRDGLNREHVMVSYSTDRGASWAAPTAVERAGDRGYYSAPGISPDGRDLYLVYNAFTTPWRYNTTDPRTLVGVVLHADIAAAGAPANWMELHRGAPGDPRASSQNNLEAEFLGDYVYAVATRTYGAAVWNDARSAGVCAAINAWRMSLRSSGEPLPFGVEREAIREEPGDDEEEAPNQEGDGGVPVPEPNNDCPATFGNTDIYGGSWADPTPEPTTSATATATASQPGNGQGKPGKK